MFVTGNRNTMLPFVKYFDQLTRRGLNRDFFFSRYYNFFLIYYFYVVLT